MQKQELNSLKSHNTKISENKNRELEQKAYIFLFKRLLSFIPGEKGVTEKVTKVLENENFLNSLSSEQLFNACQCALEHGLIDKGLELFTKLNSKFPDLEKAWQEHKELLELLERKNDLISLRYRAKRLLFKENLKTLPKEPSNKNYDNDNDNYQNHFVEYESLAKKDVFQPFSEIQEKQELLKIYMAIFRGRDDVFARQWVDRSKENTGYVPIKRPMTIVDIEDHISGSKTYGIYLMNPNNTVWTGVIDIDLKKHFRTKGALKGRIGLVKREVHFIFENIRAFASQANIKLIAEFSGGKGYHLWLPVSKPVPARSMRDVLSGLIKNLIGKTEFFDLELFPKQDKLTGKGLGNLVKLPLGIHRLTGKRSFFIQTGTRDLSQQLSLIRGFSSNSPDIIINFAQEVGKADIIVHPALSTLKERFPLLVELQQACNVVGEIITLCLSGHEPGEKARKVLISTIGHLTHGRQMLHFILSKTPSYNRPLLDYEISRLRGTPLGCKRIHSLTGRGEGGIDCTFELKKGEYAHPLLHLSEWSEEAESLSKSERIENLQDAIINLRTAIDIVERFL